MIGDYGVGKSSTLKEVYRILCADYHRARSYKFPIYINLRDHWGQDNITEILERHARNIGYKSPTQIVRGFRAGCCHVIIDGFDEIALVGWANRGRKLSSARYNYMRCVRDFIANMHANCGVILAGRAHYFDDFIEMKKCFGWDESGEILEIKPLTIDKINQFTVSFGFTGSQMPNWLPNKPLLLSYLLTRKVFDDKFLNPPNDDPSYGWNYLIDKICAREARIEAGLEGSSIRSILTEIAAYARSRIDGLGPIAQKDLERGFINVIGSEPDESGMQILQRLPGLGARLDDLGNRYFVDTKYAEMLACGKIVEYITSPYGSNIHFEAVHKGLSLDGNAFIGTRLKESGIEDRSVTVSLYEALKNGHIVYKDIIGYCLWRGINVEMAVSVKDYHYPILGVAASDSCRYNVIFEECMIECLEVDYPKTINGLPHFKKCYIEEVNELIRNEESDKIFEECDISSFVDSKTTNNDVLQLPLGSELKVLLVCLKKLYLQKGSCRRQSAFYRGLPQSERKFVDFVLGKLMTNNYAVKERGRGISDECLYYPNRSRTNEVLLALENPLGNGQNMLNDIIK